MLNQALTTEGEFYATAITLGWAIFNFLLLLSSLGAVVERKQRRTVHRIPVNEGAVVKIEGSELPARIMDISTGGLLINLHRSAQRYLEPGDTLVVHPEDYPGMKGLNFHVKVRRLSTTGDTDLLLGVEFAPKDLREKFQKVAFVHGRSDRYVEFQENRSSSRPGIIAGISHLSKLGLKYTPRFFVFFLQSIFRSLGSSAGRAGQVFSTDSSRKKTKAA
jgi:hypothetical protein